MEGGASFGFWDFNFVRTSDLFNFVRTSKIRMFSRSSIFGLFGLFGLENGLEGNFDLSIGFLMANISSMPSFRSLGALICPFFELSKIKQKNLQFIDLLPQVKTHF